MKCFVGFIDQRIKTSSCHVRKKKDAAKKLTFFAYVISQKTKQNLEKKTEDIA